MSQQNQDGFPVRLRSESVQYAPPGDCAKAVGSPSLPPAHNVEQKLDRRGLSRPKESMSSAVEIWRFNSFSLHSPDLGGMTSVFSHVMCSNHMHHVRVSVNSEGWKKH